MASALLFIITATTLISLISFIGIFVLAKKTKLSNKTLGLLVSFAAGAILAAVFFDLLPEAYEALHTFTWVVVGIIFFFILEAAVHWHHHGGDCEHHKHKPVVLLNTIGDAIHNFLDGILIAASFLLNTETGIATTLAIAIHEIPQEIGDYSILIKGGASKKRAIGLNFFSAIFAILGGITGYYFITNIQGALPYIISLAAGGLLYIATTDVLPDLHKERNYKRIIMQILAFIAGIALLGLLFGINGEHNHEVRIDTTSQERYEAQQAAAIQHALQDNPDGVFTHEQLHEYGIAHEY